MIKTPLSREEAETIRSLLGTPRLRHLLGVLVTSSWEEALEAYDRGKTQQTLDLTKPVQTRDGRAARIICTDQRHPDGFCVVALVADSSGSGREVVSRYKPNGSSGGLTPTGRDLVNVPEEAYETKTKCYVNVFRSHVPGSSVTFGPVTRERTTVSPTYLGDFIKTVEFEV